MGDDAAERIAEPGPEIRALLVDADRPGSVAHSVRRLLDAAAQVRDQLSNDTWLVIGHLDRDLAELDRNLPVAAVTGALGRVMAAMLALSGLSAESMVRDDGWQFMEAGRRLERALQLCALLRPRSPPAATTATDSLVIESVLTAAESIVTYRRRYRSQAQVETLLDLLVLDVTNPRSLAYQVERLADAVGCHALTRGQRAPGDRPHRRRAGHPGRAGRHQRARPGRRRRQRTLTVDGAARLGGVPRRRHVAAHPTRRAARPAHFSHQLPQRVGGAQSELRRTSSPCSSRTGAWRVTYRVVHRTAVPLRRRRCRPATARPTSTLARCQGQQTLRRRRSRSTRSPSTTASAATSSATGPRTSPCSSPTGRSR